MGISLQTKFGIKKTKSFAFCSRDRSMYMGIEVYYIQAEDLRCPTLELSFCEELAAALP